VVWQEFGDRVCEGKAGSGVRLEEEGGFLLGEGYSEDLMARRHVETYLRIWDVVLALHLLYRLTNMVFTSMRLNNMGIRFAMPRC
jgi:hypothetical protein